CACARAARTLDCFSPHALRGAPRMAKPCCLDKFRVGPALAIAAWCLAPLGSGCRAVDNAQVDVMERDLRQQQQYIYELEDYSMEHSAKPRESRPRQTPVVVEPKATSRTPRKEPTLADDSAIDLDAPRQTPRQSRPTAPRTGGAAAPATSPESAADMFEEGPA